MRCAPRGSTSERSPKLIRASPRGPSVCKISTKCVAVKRAVSLATNACASSSSTASSSSSNASSSSPSESPGRSTIAWASATPSAGVFGSNTRSRNNNEMVNDAMVTCVPPITSGLVGEIDAEVEVSSHAAFTTMSRRLSSSSLPATSTLATSVDGVSPSQARLPSPCAASTNCRGRRRRR